MKAVLITTAHRGVFFGELVESNAPASVALVNARNCIYWSQDVGGFLGLAASGPSPGCRIGAVVDKIELYDVTSVTEVNEAAAKRWKEAPTWK